MKLTNFGVGIPSNSASLRRRLYCVAVRVQAHRSFRFNHVSEEGSRGWRPIIGAECCSKLRGVRPIDPPVVRVLLSAGLIQNGVRG